MPHCYFLKNFTEISTSFSQNREKRATNISPSPFEKCFFFFVSSFFLFFPNEAYVDVCSLCDPFPNRLNNERSSNIIKCFNPTKYMANQPIHIEKMRQKNDNEKRTRFVSFPKIVGGSGGEQIKADRLYRIGRVYAAYVTMLYRVIRRCVNCHQTENRCASFFNKFGISYVRLSKIQTVIC